MSKLKIATHDSATGEASHGLVSLLLLPFAKTQSKTIKQQYDAGCRSFDIRVRWDKRRHLYVCAHGLWKSKRSAASILNQINEFKDRCEVCITYEGVCKDVEKFSAKVTSWRLHFDNIIYGSICTKYATKVSTKVDYIKIQYVDKEYSGGIQGFLPLDGRSWHTYLPIPWLWDRLYKRPHKFNDKEFTFVDFL